MVPIAYYNEHDPEAAAWLRELIKQNLIAPGVVDERSILDVRPADLVGYTQCHFFAGIGTFSYALRLAGWPDDRPIWTGSCPCQPFSSAGQGAGFADERHLWPAFYWLIAQRRPGAVLGEQVSGKDAEPWLDNVQVDLEGLGYAFGALAFPSASVGAPHIRDRTYWVGYAGGARLEGLGQHGVDPYPAGPQNVIAPGSAPSPGSPGWLAYANGAKPAVASRTRARPAETHCDGTDSESDGCSELPEPEYPGPTNGFWRDADWLGCTDGKWRAAESGAQPLASGSPHRVGRLRGYGNGCNARQAQVFIEAVTESINERN